MSFTGAAVGPPRIAANRAKRSGGRGRVGTRTGPRPPDCPRGGGGRRPERGEVRGSRRRRRWAAARPAGRRPAAGRSRPHGTAVPARGMGPGPPARRATRPGSSTHRRTSDRGQTGVPVAAGIGRRSTRLGSGRSTSPAGGRGGARTRGPPRDRCCWPSLPRQGHSAAEVQPLPRYLPPSSGSSSAKEPSPLQSVPRAAGRLAAPVRAPHATGRGTGVLTGLLRLTSGASYYSIVPVVPSVREHPWRPVRGLPMMEARQPI